MGGAKAQGGVGSGKKRRQEAQQTPKQPARDSKLPESEWQAVRKERREVKRAAAVDAARAQRKYVTLLKERLLQPSRKHYGGQGYARDSVFMELEDPRFSAKFGDLWDEHIEGFSGKSFKKRRGEDGKGLLWRQRLEEKQAGIAVKAIDTVVAQLTDAPAGRKKRRGEPEASIAARPTQRNTAAPAHTGHALGQAPKRTALAVRPLQAAAGGRPSDAGKGMKRRRKGKPAGPVVGDADKLLQQALAAYNG